MIYQWIKTLLMKDELYTVPWWLMTFIIQSIALPFDEVCWTWGTFWLDDLSANSLSSRSTLDTEQESCVQSQPWPILSIPQLSLSFQGGLQSPTYSQVGNLPTSLMRAWSTRCIATRGEQHPVLWAFMSTDLPAFLKDPASISIQPTPCTTW